MNSTKKIKSTQVQIGDLLMRGYRGAMRVASIDQRDGFVHFYDNKGTHYCLKPNGLATIVNHNN